MRTIFLIVFALPLQACAVPEVERAPAPASRVTNARDGALAGRIVGIADGDTLTLLDASKTSYKIRLQGIDAPESKQAFGTRSRQSLSNLAFNRFATAECIKPDRYGRSVCKILVDGVDVNLAQVRAGMAWHYKAYQRDQTPADRTAYAAAEQQARAARRGLWVDARPTPPWEFRRRKRR